MLAITRLISLFAGILIASTASIASAESTGLEKNPFFPPSARNPVIEIKEPDKVTCDASHDDVKALTAMLESESSNIPDIDIPADKEGHWTQDDISKSKFLGEINGYRVYFNELKQVYFNVDTDPLRAAEKGQ